MTLSMSIKKCNTHHKRTHHLLSYWRFMIMLSVFFIVMPRVIRLDIIVLSVIMGSVIIQCFVVLSVVMLSVMAS